MESQALDADVLWVLMCGFLVALMQAGFACLESGMVREKNSINVAIKNLVDFCLTCALFTVIGFGLMFGPSWGPLDGWVGKPYFPLSDSGEAVHISFFIFQVMFAGTAATIISGAVAERMSFVGYMITTVIIAGLVYPIVGHWIWAGGDKGEAWGWLGQLGFHDFAGSTVVHSVGGWLALAAILIIGPRIGRFGPLGRPIEGHNLPMSTLGVFLLWFGFFGFNGGSTYAIDTRVPEIIANTAVAGATGGLAGLMLSWLVWKRPQVDRIVNGVIAGLVASCAGCDVISGLDAMAVGFVAGILCVLSMHWLEQREIDDVIGAVPAHLVAGAWGTVAVALFAPLDAFGPDVTRWHQLSIQVLGVAVSGLFSFGVGYALLWGINRVLPLRVSAEAERIGLNVAEHGATTALLDLITQMDSQARQGDFSRAVTVDAETDAAHIAVFYNAVLDKFNTETERRHVALERLNQIANHDALTGLANRRRFMEHLGRIVQRARRGAAVSALLYLDLDGFKQINDSLGHEAGDMVLVEAAHRMKACLRDEDMLARLGGDEFAILIEGGEEAALNAGAVAEKLLDCLVEPIPLKDATGKVGVSIGIALFGGLGWSGESEAVLRAADQAMYEAKLAGKGTWRQANAFELEGG
ncbi:ammonium transporter [Rhodospirillum sp. A1_3_36]|uniref:ammonium transporter n=1 Tax=Rhodospirillum sp. A1_3_36 TaxID=3391666 RepID=UPI0039A5F6EE